MSGDLSNNICPLEAPVEHLTHLGLVRLSVLRQLDELVGEHAAAVAQDVTLQLHVWIRTHKLHHDGVAGGVDPNLQALTPRCRGEETDIRSGSSNTSSHIR